MRDLNEVMIKSLEKRKELNRSQINRQLTSSESNNLKLIKEEAKELCGRYADFFNHHYGYLLGATCGHDDYYWVYIDKDLKVGFSSCVCNPDMVEGLPNNDLSVLDYLVRNDAESIIDKVKSVISCHDDVFFTPIYINGKEYKINDMII